MVCTRGKGCAVVRTAPLPSLCPLPWSYPVALVAPRPGLSIDGGIPRERCDSARTTMIEHAHRERVCIRVATVSDLPEILRMLAADSLRAQPEQFSMPLAREYTDAFAAIERDSNT